MAVAKSDVNLIKILLSRGADPEAKDYRGKRPTDYTRETSVLKVLGALRTAEKPVPIRSSLQKRVMQKVSFRVAHRHTKVRGVAGESVRGAKRRAERAGLRDVYVQCCC